MKAVARRHDALFQVHLSETAEEVDLLLKRYGQRPVCHLAKLGILDRRTVAAHCVWVDQKELDLLAGHGVKVAHDPESNMKLGAGIAPVAAMLRQGIEVGLGTDGCASNNNLDLFGEMGMCARLHKLATGDPAVLSARQVVEMATLGGARVLGMEERIGSIVPGKEADLILVDTRQPHGTPLYNPYSHLAYAASGADVRTVVMPAKSSVRDRKVLTFDVEAAMAEVRAIAARSPLRRQAFRRPGPDRQGPQRLEGVRP